VVLTRRPFGSDIGALLAHRDVAGYTLSMSHLFDLTGPSFAALRLPAGLAAAGLLLGPVIAWVLRRQRHHFEATVSVAFTSAVFLIAAHIALVRFEPMLSSRAMADTINHIAPRGTDATLILYGDVADGSSLLFYTQRQALLVNGRVSSVLWGSNYPDAPRVLISDRRSAGAVGHRTAQISLRARETSAPTWPACWERAPISCRSFPTKLSTPTARSDC
jgi:hypothetical protein